MDLNDIRRFLNTKGVSDECPSCHEHSWYFNGYSLESSYLGLSYTSAPRIEGFSESLNGGYARPMILLICANCAFVRLYDHYLVDQWLKANPVPAFIPESSQTYGQ